MALSENFAKIYRDRLVVPLGKRTPVLRLCFMYSCYQNVTIFNTKRYKGIQTDTKEDKVTLKISIA